MTSVIQKMLASDTEHLSGGTNISKQVNEPKPNETFYDANVLLSMLTSEEPPKLKGGTNKKTLDNTLSTLDNTLSTTDFNTKIKKHLKGGNNSDSSVNTQFLENKLLSLISNNNNMSGGHNNTNVDDIKKFFLDLKNKGVKVDVKLNDKTFSEYFDMRATTTDINSVNFSPTSTENILNGKVMTSTNKNKKSNNIFSATSDMQGGGFSATSEMQGGGYSATSEMQGGGYSATSEMQGGGNIFLSATSEMNGGDNGLVSPTSSDNEFYNVDLKGGKKGSNPGFLAHIELTKHIAKKLGRKGGPEILKISSVVKQDMKEKFPTLDSVQLSKKAMEHFDKNMDHYKKLLKSK